MYLQFADKGQEVSRLQNEMNKAGATPALVVDGKFGPKTEAAVKALQVKHGIEPIGGTSPRTWEALGCAPWLGCDVSHYQGEIPWPSLAEAGLKFAIIKAGQGRGRDAKFATNWAGAKAAGMGRGAYWYGTFREGEAVEEARFACQTVGRLEADDLPLTLDVEENLGPERLLSWTRAFCDEAWRLTGKRPIVYTYVSCLRYRMKGGEDLSKRFPLWIARYADGTTDPGYTGDWRKWAIWQWTSHGNWDGNPRADKPRIKGWNCKVDYDWMPDGARTWSALCAPCEFAP